MFDFTSFRAECLKALGFDGFFRDALSETADIYAYMIPQSVFEAREYTSLVNYLQAALECYGWSCKTEVLEKGVYETNHYRARFHTHILGPHILLHLQPIDPAGTKPPRPNVPQWTVVEVATKSYTWLHEAAFPAHYESTRNRLIEKATATATATA